MSKNSKISNDVKNIFKERFKSSAEITWCNSFPKEYEKDQFNFVFSIHDFNKIKKKNGEYIQSPLFKMTKNSAIKWFLRVFPCGYKEENKHHMSIFLYLKSKIPNLTVKAKFHLDLQNNSNNFDDLDELLYTFTSESKGGYGFPKMIKIEELKKILQPDNVLNVMCSIESYSCTDPDARIIDMKNLRESAADEDESENYFEALFADRRLADVTFIVDDKELLAHKCILSVAGPIFSAMFGKTEEKSMKNTVKISDIAYQVFNEMLRFIYTRKVELLSDVAPELIFVAHRYGIRDLKEVCEVTLCKNINLNNSLMLLIIADSYNAKELKKLTLDFIVEHKKNFIHSDELKHIIRTNPKLCESIILSMVSLY